MIPPFLRSKRARGFTILETVLVIALFVIIMSALATLYLSFSTSTVVTETLADSAGRSAAALSVLHADISAAESTLASSDFSGTTYFSGANSLVLALPSIDASGNVISGKTDYLAYYVSGGSLYRRLAPDAASSRTGSVKVLLESIGSISFTYDNLDYNAVTKITTDLVGPYAGRTNVRSEVIDVSYLHNHT